jgi:hypothetical protein
MSGARRRSLGSLMNAKRLQDIGRLFRRYIERHRYSICGHLPEATREAHRLTISELPVKKPVCDLCWEALAENCGWFQPPPQEGTKH